MRTSLVAWFVLVVAATAACASDLAPLPAAGGNDGNSIRFDAPIPLRVYDSNDRLLGTTPSHNGRAVVIPRGTEWYVEIAGEWSDESLGKACDEIERQKISGLALCAREQTEPQQNAEVDWRRLGKLTSVKRLSLRGASDPIRAYLSLAPLKQLERLDLAGAQLQDWHVDNIAGFSKLQQLNLQGTKITDEVIGYLAKLPQLKILDLSWTAITDEAVPHLQRMRNLTELNLEGTRLSADGLAELRHCSQLESLDLSNTAADDSTLRALQPLARLKVLKLGRDSDREQPAQTQITDESVPFLHSFPRLEELDIRGSRITNEGLAQLPSLPALRKLHLANCRRISDEGLAAVSQIGNLESLDVSETRMTDAGLRLLANRKSLRQLALGDLPITDAGIAALGALDRIELLRVNGTRISDAALNAVSRLSNLEELDLSQTAVSDGALARLRGLKRLSVLSLMDCERISDRGLAALPEFPALRLIAITTGGGITSDGADLLTTKCADSADVTVAPSMAVLARIQLLVYVRDATAELIRFAGYTPPLWLQ